MQIHVYRDLVGDPIQITNHQTSIQSFEPFGDGFVFTSSRGKSNSDPRIGNFKHIENEEPDKGLFYVSSERSLRNIHQSITSFEQEHVEDIESFFEITRLLTEPLAIDSFIVSPIKNTIYLNCQTRSEMIFEDETMCFKIELNPEKILDELDSSSLDEALSSINIIKLALPKGYKVREVSPDGNKILLTGRDVERIPETRPDLWILVGYN